jgi:hypothetical protein
LFDFLDPRFELFPGNGNGLEVHVGVTADAELLVLAEVGARFVGHEMQPGLHAGHGVYLTAELRDKKGGHDRCGRYPEAERNFGRENELIDSGDILVRIDKQPFPI